MTHRVFSYGTLRQAEVQRALYGREVPTVDDALPGFRIDWVLITDAEVLRVIGSDRHPILRRGTPDDRVDGASLELSDAELAATDAYEVSDYERRLVTLASGLPAFVYLAREDETEIDGSGLEAEAVELLVDVANVLGSRADGWWRDRAGATTRLLTQIGGLRGARVAGPGASGYPVTVARVTVVIEGAAKRADAPAEIAVIRAPGSGDDAIVQAAEERVATPGDLIVVTADRGLRARLPEGAAVVGPGWLNGIIGR